MSLAAPGPLVAVLQESLVVLLDLLLLLPDGLPGQLRRHGRGLHCRGRLEVQARLATPKGSKWKKNKSDSFSAP